MASLSNSKNVTQHRFMETSGVRTLGARPSNLMPRVEREPWALDHSSPTCYHCAMPASYIVQ